MSPLSRAISSVSGRGLGRSPADGTFFKRSRSRLPIDIVHRFSLDDLRVSSLSSGPWYGSVRRRLRGGPFGASGGGVGGRLWDEKSNNEMIKELCNCTTIAYSQYTADFELLTESHTEIWGIEILTNGVVELGSGDLSSDELLEYIKITRRFHAQRSP
jgi:hypothetical protein